MGPLPVAAALAFLVVIPGLAQFSGLATPADGSRVYFSTPLRQKNTGQPPWGKLFRADASGLTLVESRDRQVPDPPPQGIATGVGLAHPTNPYDLRGADISSDGRVFAAAAWRGCVSGGSYCSKMENYFTTITTGGKSAEYQGNLRLSANGRWAFGNGSHPSLPDDYPYTAYLVNVETGEQTSLAESGGIATAGRPIAGDGTAVIAFYNTVTVIRGQSRLRIPVNGQAYDAVLDPSGNTVLFTVCSDGNCTGRALTVADALTGDQRVLVSDGYAASPSDDGRTVLFLRSRDGVIQAWLIQADGTGERQLTHDPDGIVRAILSGDGGTVYAVAGGGRLLRIEVGGGAAHEIISRTPALDTRSSTTLSPNALVTFTGVALSETSAGATPPLPYQLAGVGIVVQGKQAKLVSVQPTAITILAPPDITATTNETAPVLLQVDSSSPFEGSIAQAVIYAEGPAYLGVTVHQDWSALVTRESPAAPSEVLHSYAAGLGATIPAIAYGDPAPSQPPFAVLVKPYVCRNEGSLVDILWQGLAPALAGIYQIDWRVPASPTATGADLFCQHPEGPPWFYVLIPVRSSTP